MAFQEEWSPCSYIRTKTCWISYCVYFSARVNLLQVTVLLSLILLWLLQL